MSKAAIEDFYSDDRKFPPSNDFKSRALITDSSLHDAAGADFEAFWADQARTLVSWSSPFSKVLSWDLPYAKWFEDGTLNVSYNCLDRHVEAGLGDRIAFHFVGEPGDTRTITYAELLADVQRFANVLKSLDVRHGDRVNIYMPMIPEAVVAMLACARIGAVHSVVFGGFSSEALSDRMNDASAKVLITADGGWRRGSVVPLKANADLALATSPQVGSVVVVQRTNTEVSWTEGRDHWWHDLMQQADAECEPVPVNSEDLLYLLYTSGTTGKPKGIMHSSAGYLVQSAFTHKYVFDIDATRDVYWCTADIGWVTGHTYVVYGPLANGTTSVLYEGAPDTPDKDRWWSIVEQYEVNVLYTAPTAVRACMKWGTEYPQHHNLSSLRVLGSVGEPINPEAWLWYRDNIGGSTCPVVDTWWQTETGSHLIAPLPGLTVLKPGSASRPLPGISVQIVNDDGEPLSTGGGYVTIDRPWPSMMRGIWNDPERYLETYWSRFPGRYFAGDGARVDEDGDYWFLGRVDDVMNVSGHRVSTAEVESALVAHPTVAEAAVIGATDAMTGQSIVAYVVLRDGRSPSTEHGETLRTFVKTKIGAIARPKTVIFVPDVPKTRSGKIMRRLLRDVAEGRALGDTTTLADPGVVAEIESRKAGSSDD
jgi:acetyl-CoA synthetase